MGLCRRARERGVAGLDRLVGMDTYQGEFKEQIPKLKGYCPLGRLGTESEVSAPSASC
jgi:hypothetical protein